MYAIHWCSFNTEGASAVAISARKTRYLNRSLISCKLRQLHNCFDGESSLSSGSLAIRVKILLYIGLSITMVALCPVDIFCHLIEIRASIDSGSLWPRPGVILTLFRLCPADIFCHLIAIRGSEIVWCGVRIRNLRHYDSPIAGSNLLGSWFSRKSKTYTVPT